MPEMTVPTVRAGDGTVPKVSVRPAEGQLAPHIVAVRPTERTGAEPAAQVEHAVHVAAFEVVEKLEPAMQLAQTRLVVGVHAVEANWPALQAAAHVLHAGAVAPVPMA